MKSRTDIDWSNHKVDVTEHPGVLIHHIRIDGRSLHNVKFINAGGILAVTGDFGNWIFCREFHPSKEGGVSDGYWNEKLRISSVQDSDEWDAEATKRQLIHQLSEYLLDKGETHEDQTTEYYQECISKCDEHEFDYTYYAYREYPSNWDSECVVFVKKTKQSLKCVYDAFDEICRRIKENDANKN